MLISLSDRPSDNIISGRGYGIAWGGVRVETPDREGRWQWYTLESRRAVWWDADGRENRIAEEPFDLEVNGETFRFVAAEVLAYRPELGAMEVRCFNLDFYDWMRDNPGEPTNDWAGNRYAVVNFPVTPPWADFNADGEVNTLDFSEYLDAWSAATQESGK